MTIKYAEITIIFDTENEGLFTSLKRNWLGYETICEENSDIITSYDDDNITNWTFWANNDTRNTKFWR
jgi:hypothetical protein